MKVAFVGKGGSGKTTLASLTARALGADRRPVLAIDADINQHLGEALGLTEKQRNSIPAMGIEIDRIKQYLRGTNKRIKDPSQMIKTTPPGNGSRLLTVSERNELFGQFAIDINGVRFMRVGEIEEADMGVKCYHAKNGSVELLLNHIAEREDEYVIVDMTAGADAFSSGLFTRFDVTFLVVEPTIKSCQVYEQYKTYADPYGVVVRPVANKISDQGDLAFIQDRIGEEVSAAFEYSAFVCSMEKGETPDISELEEANTQALGALADAIDSGVKDWDTFYKYAIEFHKKNAESWANESVGEDLRSQIDPEFSLYDAVRSM
ncbi:MAG: ATP-binding protein [Candidatus Paceibacterota bacterium]